MEKDLEIKIEDRYGEECLLDQIHNENAGTVVIKRPKGFVEIYEVDKDGSKKLLGKHNLVVYQGREYVAIRIFNVANAALPTIDPTEFVTWFGVGSGGCRPADPFDPIPPTNLDTSLGTDVPIDPTNAAYADFHDGSYYKHPFDSITYQQDVDNYNSWLITLVVTTLSNEDGVGQQINEAGLFTAKSSAGGYSGPFHLYSRVTFPTIVKTNTRQLVFVWYIFT